MYIEDPAQHQLHRPILQVSHPFQRLSYLFNSKAIERFIAQYQVIRERLSEGQRAYLEPKYLQMKTISTQMHASLESASGSYEGWSTSQVGPQCRIAVRTRGTVVELRGDGIINTNAKQIIMLAYLVKLYHAWVPFCQISSDVRQVSPLEKIAFIKFKIPLIKDRFVFLKGVGIDRIESNDTIVVYASGLSLQQVPESHREHLRNCAALDLKHFTLELKYRGKEWSEFKGYAVVDHEISMLPEWVVRLVIKEMAKALFERVIGRLEEFEETIFAKELKENYAENKDFYHWLDKKMGDWEAQKK